MDKFTISFIPPIQGKTLYDLIKTAAEESNYVLVNDTYVNPPIIGHFVVNAEDGKISTTRGPRHELRLDYKEKGLARMSSHPFSQIYFTLIDEKVYSSLEGSALLTRGESDLPCLDRFVAALHIKYQEHVKQTL